MAEKIFSQPSSSPNQSHFARVPKADIPRSTFNRSSGLKTTFDASKLYPIFVDEVLPGDTFDMNATGFCRLATPLKPIFDNLHMDLHFWFVPNRLVWQNWQRFMGEQDSPDDDITGLTIPTTPINNQDVGDGSPWTNDSLPMYMGLPQTPAAQAYDVSALPFRCVNLIFNEWYRDENLQQPYQFSDGDGPDANWNNAVVPPRGKRKDYFTSCLPWPQKSQNPVSIPIGDTAPVLGIGNETNTLASSQQAFNQADGSQAPLGPGWISNLTTGDGSSIIVQENPDNIGFPNIFADLTSATSVTINDLRTAFQIQKLLERDARGGTRYTELVLSHFGVHSPDARLQRPEFLGGSTRRVNIHPIANTVGSDNQGQLLPQGELAAYGTSVPRGTFSKSFTEHGHIIGFVSVRADLTYQQGADRMWFRSQRYDFYWPTLSHLGEQATYTREIFCTGDPANDLTVFGYQERNAEYRFKPSKITGLFASDNPASLDVWHLAQDFETAPQLNNVFIQENVPLDRAIAVPSEPHFLADFWFDLKCTRPMPVYAVPGLIDHF